MAIEYTIDPEKNLIRMRCTGDFTIEEVMAHTERVNADPLFRRGMDTLGDYSEAQLAGDVSSMAQLIDQTVGFLEIRGNCRWAVIVPEGDFASIVTMFDMVTRKRGAGIETRAFQNADDALEWLSQPRVGGE